jgi:hypothetical protein
LKEDSNQRADTTARTPNDLKPSNRYVPSFVPQSAGLFGNSAAPPTSRNLSYSNAQSKEYSPPQQTVFSSSPFSFGSGVGAPQSQQARPMLAQQRQWTPAFAPNRISPALSRQSSPGQPQGNHALQDYQMQTMVLEQQYVSPGTNSMFYCKVLARHPVEVSSISLTHFMRSAQSFHFVELR